MSARDGGAAFPRPMSEDRTNGDLPDGNDMIPDQTGISARDYFAAAAVGGLLTSGTGRTNAGDVARNAYQLADAMLAERDKPKLKPVPAADEPDPA